MSMYKEYSLKELKDLAKELGISNSYKLNKDELIKKIEEVNSINPLTNKKAQTEKPKKAIEKKNDLVSNEEVDFSDLEKEVEKILDKEEKENKKIETIIKETPVEKTENKKIDLSEEEAIFDTENLIKEIQQLKPEKTSGSSENSNEEILSTDENIIFKEPEIKDEEVLKPQYQASMLANIIIEKAKSSNPSLFFEVLNENNLKEEGLRRLINNELVDGEPFSTEKKDLFVNDYLKDFKAEISRIVKIKEIKPIELTVKHKKWIDYFKIYKLTAKDYLKRYPNHSSKDLLLEIVKFQELEEEKKKKK